jgi:hypothetical protein
MRPSDKSARPTGWPVRPDADSFVRWNATRLRALLSFGLAAWLPSWAPAAQESNFATTVVARPENEFEFDVPAQPASSALLEFARQANVEVIFSFDSLSRVRSNALQGRYRPNEALVVLLKNTGFGPRKSGTGGRKYVVAANEFPTGMLSGSIHLPDGRPAQGVRVLLAKTPHAVTTNSRGEFVFRSVPAGNHRLIAVAPGFQPLAFPGVQVPANNAVTLPPRAFRLTDDPTRLSTFFVRDKPTRRSPFDRSEAQPGDLTAASSGFALQRERRGRRD